MRKSNVLLPLLSTLIGTSAVAQTATYEYGAAPSGRAMRVSSNQKVVGESPMPCQPKAVFRYNATHVVAGCVDKPGLLVVDISEPAKPKAIEIKGYEGKLSDVYLVGDKVWLDIEGRSSPLVLGVEAAENAHADLPVQPEVVETDLAPKPVVVAETGLEDAVPPARVGKVLSVLGRDIVVDFGTNDGFKKDDVVEFYTTPKIQVDSENITREETIAIGRIKSIQADRAVVEVGLNEDLSAGVAARSTTESFRTNFIAPPRNSGSDEILMTLRPYLPIGTMGGGAIIEASWMHRFENPLAIQVSVSPVGFAITEQGNASVFAAHTFFTYDTRIFQVGLGVGLARFTDDLPYHLEPGQKRPDSMAIGVSAGQYLRLGARDGLSLTTTTNFVVRNGEWDFGGLTSEIQAPIGRLLADTWVIARGGGGLPGYGFGEVGLRTLLQGNGNKGSVFITPTLGYGSISTQVYEDCDYGERGSQCLEDVDYGGPMVGVTLEWRP